MQLVLFAGGGTGGHIYPNVAVSERLEECAPEAGVRFVVSSRPGDARIVERVGIPAAAIEVRPLPSPARPWELAGFAGAWRRSVAQMARLLAEDEVTAVVATGGFVSGPPVVAAHRAGIPVALVNLDAIPGLANRYLARLADVVFTTYETSRLPQAQQVGLPLRRSATASVPASDARRQLDLDPNLRTLFITGATHGAESMIEAVREVVSQPTVRSWLHGWQLLHQCGRHNPTSLQGAYDAAGIPARVVPYLDNMGVAWAAADLAIGRAGAGTVAEAWANTVPTVFLPNPHHPHQRRGLNTQPLVEAGGAQTVEDLLDPERTAIHLGQVLSDLLSDAERRAAMQDALARSRPSSGADVLAAWLRNRLR